MNLSSPLIGLGGRLRSGKDVVADRLVEKHGYVKLGMSDALHEAMLAIDPIVTHEEMVLVRKTSEGLQWRRDTPARYSEIVEHIGYVEAKKIPEVRRLLQNLGTDVGRNMIDENVWVNVMARKIDDHRGAGHPVVVTGLRFPNEVQMVEELGGLAAWVERPGLHATSAGTAAHASENSVSAADFHLTIDNSSDLEALEAQADGLAVGLTLGGRARRAGSGQREVLLQPMLEDDRDAEKARDAA